MLYCTGINEPTSLFFFLGASLLLKQEVVQFLSVLLKT